jgi:16S rRNA (uracil1498-N3)-methyltransferase
MACHRIYVESMDSAALRIVVGSEEARHAARVKRVRVGEEVELFDGRGRLARGIVEAVGRRGKKADWVVEVRVRSFSRVEPLRPRVEVWTATPKGDRATAMIDALSQVGAAAWRALETARGIVEPRSNKVDRLERVAVEASKQSGRAWVMEVGQSATIAEAVSVASGAAAPADVVVASAGAERYRPRGQDRVVLLIGPEGGWTTEELDRLRAAGARAAAFGQYVMRIETAATAAAAIILAAESDHREGSCR